MPKGARFTAKDLALIGAALGTADFLLEGRLSAPAARALKRYLLPQAARTVPRLGSTALQVGKTIAVRHPYLTAGAIAYYTYKNRDELGSLVEQGYEIIQPAVSATGEFIGTVNPGFDQTPERGQLFAEVRATKRKKSTFNKAVSAGLKALKGSTSYGKKGVLSNAKAAFKTATKAASARSKGKKMPKSGPAKVAYKAAKGVYTDEILRRKMK